jgi:hypothetical protein
MDADPVLDFSSGGRIILPFLSMTIGEFKPLELPSKGVFRPVNEGITLPELVGISGGFKPCENDEDIKGVALAVTIRGT